MDIDKVEKKLTELSDWYESYEDFKPIGFFFAKNNIYKWNEYR